MEELEEEWDDEEAELKADLLEEIANAETDA